MLKNRVFNHTHGFNDKLLEKTGMEVDFARVCKNVGWTSFADVSELGSRDISIQLLWTLVETKEDVVLRFFHQEFSLTWKDFSTLLGFHQCCTVDANQALIGFHKESFLEFITRTESSGGARCNDIRNSTLRLMHKWVAITSFLGRMFGLFVYMNFVFFMPW